MINSMHCDVQRQIIADRMMLFGLCLSFLLHLCWPKNGGMGSYLPYNMVGWFFAAVICTSFLLVHPGNAPGTYGMLLIAGASLMTLQLIWSPTGETRYYVLPRITGLWGIIAFWITLKQCQFSGFQKFLLFYALALACIVENLVVPIEPHGFSSWQPESWQLIIDKYGQRGVRVSPQVNVADSFLAQSLASSLTKAILGNGISINTEIRLGRRHSPTIKKQ